MTGKPANTNRMLLSMIALGRTALPDPRQLCEALAPLFGVAVAPEAVEAKENALTFPLGGNRAAVALVAAPIPWSKLEGPCETAWWWPDARASMEGHRSHLLVVLAGEEGDPVQRSLALTRLVAAVTACVEAAGIFWGGGGVVHEPQAFIDKARHAAPEKLPLELWIDFRIEPNEDGTLRLFTTGMKSLGRLEIEIPHSRHDAAEVFDFARAIADYLLARGAEIRDGHTIGRHEDEKIPSSHAPSMLDSRMTVLRFEF